MAIKIEEIKQTNYYTEEGVPFDNGDMLLIEADGREVLGYFDGMETGYFRMTNMARKRAFKYRLASIGAVKVVEEIKVKTTETEKTEGEE